MSENTKEKFGFYKDASAGTGKTYWIVKKKLKEIYTKQDELHQKGIEYDFNNTLIVTFTEKATGELRNRIRKEYKDVTVDDMHIFTIHSFCQRILKDYAAYVGKPSELSLVDAGIDSSAFIEKWIRDDLPNNKPFSKILDSLKKNAKDDFSKKVKKLSKDLSKAIQTYEPGIQIEEPRNNWYSDILSSVIDADGQERKLVKYLYEEWLKDKENRKVQTYSDMIHSVHDALSGNSLLCKELKKKYKVAIIDEFQDTNQIQWEIFSSIFNDEEHCLYVVGDPKQSIYAFQGADVNVYNSSKNSLIEIDKELINYRSSPEMIDACNALFRTPGFFDDKDNGITFGDSGKPDDKNRLKMNLCEEESAPLWFPDREVDENEFARFAVDRIVYSTSKRTNNPKFTNLRIPQKKKDNNGKELDEWELRNVSYGDFAILARTTSEMKPVEQELRRRGVPYIRYKDRNLFNGLECQSWISLLSAIDADDFTGSRRRLLNEALYSKFFSVPFDRINDEAFDYPSNPYRKLLFRWHGLAKDKHWTELMESIYENSQLESKLAESDKLQSLVKFRQIGNFIIEYLYENNCSLLDVCLQLSKLSTSFSEDNGALVERGTDKDCVQIMTIHASKGLEFPIVIPVAGFKGRNNQIPQVYTYHNPTDKVHYIGFSTSTEKKDDQKSAKDLYWDEQLLEWRRLFYVAYTRARELMILPRYKKWSLNDDNGKKNDYSFLKDAIEKYLNDEKQPKNYFSVPEYVKFTKQKDDESGGIDSSSLEKQEKIIGEVFKNSKGLAVYKHSYSSLSHPKKNGISETDAKDDEDDDSKKDSASLKGFDMEAISHPFAPNEIEIQSNNKKKYDKYPKGAALGTAVHEVFEKAVFTDFNLKDKSIEAVCEPVSEDEDTLGELIAECFKKQAIKLDEDGNVLKETKSIVWNALNAELPVIRGNAISSGEHFKLSDLDEENKKAEVEFFLNPQDQSVIKKYCNGFVDLIFERQNGVYSILDWKTDTKSNHDKILDYSDFNCLKDRVDEAYSIQRVLYSYCLIKWLKQFNDFKNKSESEIFTDHFGGIYYVFVRGCVSGRMNGIYAQTWKCWDDLKAAFDNIKTRKMHISASTKGAKKNG